MQQMLAVLPAVLQRRQNRVHNYPLVGSFWCIVSCCLKLLKRRCDAASAQLQNATKMISIKIALKLAKRVSFTV